MTTGGPPPPDILTFPGRFEWERTAKRMKIDRVTKLVALVLAIYADADGWNVRPGNDRLAAEAGLKNARNVVTHLNALKNLGVIYQVSSGSRAGRRGWASEYRLSLPADLTDRVELLPDPKDHVSPGTHGSTDQVSRETRGVGNQVTGEAEQVTPQGRTSDSGDTPPSTTKHLHQEHPSSPRGEATATAEDFEHFEEFWELYPLKEYKSAAFSKWMHVTEHTDYREIIDGLRAFDFGPNPDTYPYATAWLSVHRWRPR